MRNGTVPTVDSTVVGLQQSSRASRGKSQMWEHDPRLKGQPELAGSSAGLYVCSQPTGEELTNCLGTEAVTSKNLYARDLTGRVTVESYFF